MRETCVPSGVALKDTGFGYTLSVIGGKYKMIILYWLAENKVMRHNELKRGIGTISFKTLSVMLKEMEADGLIQREEFPQVPPKVEYSLTERGRSLLPLLNLMCEWGENNSLKDLPATGALSAIEHRASK
ncbi:MAG: helix-turn-helix domain-containing protein [Paenibacillus macerans]|uniref:HxlR-like helix-turn-helix family protein n=2 Tax=Paenibacillus macerans TaxID=44252 RepID=A0A090ZCS0_PAEMA|nr:helix-turn-helix domain-containing protein [Paenibacillus macerans]KFN08223.1 hxlR-like helix-turn-helix family protein [Paenibacillus macerans]MBS5913996.1 helix-turn-helix transcriptional regulator [Paenibacillus macerans]MCY7557574.1 helix-turn-helix transcriptional regulator [Paenibacillus macerans]MDU5949484.1 helix-turn-helix domain-containing protein [Paenibacillus macerans]MDU7474740.1 helix-turn-helix domain-containing protein [Paenibacillus macerans]